MNKTIMCLINGLGIEQKNSCDAYNSEIMPGLEKMISENMFIPLETNAYNYESGYQEFNSGTSQMISEGELKKVYSDESWKSLDNYSNFINMVNASDNKLHIFCTLNNKYTYDYLKSFIKSLNISKKIIIHLILQQPDINDYKLANRFIDNLRFDGLENVKIGLISGYNVLINESLNNKYQEFLTILIKKIGAQWVTPSQKFSIYQSKNITPINSDPIYVSEDCNLENNDNILFFNNGDEDFTKLIMSLTDTNSIYNKTVSLNTLHYFSLFPLKRINGIISLFNNIEYSRSLAKYLESCEAKTLILIDKENYNIVKHINNGLKSTDSPSINYMLVDDNILFNHEQITSIINNPEYENIIINYRIDDCDDFITLQDKLKKIDNSLVFIKNDCQNKYPLIISSLFGYTKQINKDKINVLLNFNGKVPFILINNSINWKKYKLQSYATSGKILPTFIKCIKPDLKIDSLITSKSIITKLLYK